MRAHARRWSWLLLVTLFVPRLWAQSAIQYVYDDLGRLIGVTDPTGDTAVYHYDAVGNILSIDRHASSAVSIIAFTPRLGPVGTTVTIAGTGFSTTAVQNTVSFNGTAASVTSASATQLVVTVPSGATTGTIGVTAPAGSTTSATAFTVGSLPGVPTITSFSPGSGVNTASFSITGTNFETVSTNDRASLNATSLSITSASTSQLTTNVPGSAVTSGRLSVATPRGVATSATDFWVAPTGYTTGNLESKIRLNGFGDVNAATTTITSTSNVGLLLFDGAPLHRSSIKVSGATLNGTVSLLSPFAATLGSGAISGGAAFIEPIALGVTGTSTYTVLVKPTSTGHATITVYDVPADAGGPITPTAAGTAVTPSLATPGQNAKYTFTGAANGRVTANLTADSIALAAASILKPDGSTL